VREIGRALAGIGAFAGVGSLARYGLVWLVPTVSPPWVLATNSICRALACAFATWLIGNLLGKRTWAQMGWRGGHACAGYMLGGAGAGLAMATAAGLAASVVGAAARISTDLSHYFVAAAPLVSGLLAAALAEELFYRGYPLRRLADAIGPGMALLLLALGFGAAHLGNPHSSLLTTVNLALAGVWLGIAFLSPGGLPLAWGLHFGWNAGLAVLFDAPLSGQRFDLSGMRYLPGPRPWLDGGVFGPEGGLIGTFVFVAGAASLCPVLGRRRGPWRLFGLRPRAPQPCPERRHRPGDQAV